MERPLEMNKIVLKHPVVLIHGMGGFDAWALPGEAGQRIRFEYFHGVRGRWEGRVPRVLMPALPPTGSITERAEALEAYLGRETSGEPLHLVAHSMGGLDARAWLRHHEGARRTLSLTTLGTPHRGSPLATMAVERLIGPLRRMGEQLRWQGAIESLLERTASHHDLQPERCEAFNRETPDCPGVQYLSYAGAPASGQVQLGLKIGYELLARQGHAENDGLVPVESACWSGWQGTLPADHLSLIHWQPKPQARRAFDALAFYEGLLGKLFAFEE